MNHRQQSYEYIDETQNYGIIFSILLVQGSPSHGRDVANDVFDINQLSLPTPFYSVLVSILSLWPFQLYFIP